jgi:hypothetical protein
MCTIKPGPALKGYTVVQGDIFYADLTNNFDFTNVKHPVSVTARGEALAGNSTTPYVQAHFDVYGFQKLNWIKQLNNDSVVYCYDDKQMIVQIISGEGKYFGFHEKFSLDGVDAICLDAVHYQHREFLYVGCVTKNTGPGQPGYVWVITYDMATGKITHIEKTLQDDGFSIKNRLAMFVVTVQPTMLDGSLGAVSDYLYLYDQGNSNSMKSMSAPQARLYRNLGSGNLRFFKLLSIDAESLDFKIVYDYFPYNNAIVLSGRVIGPTETIITLAECTINTLKATVTCNPRIKGTTVTQGKVGINIVGQYFQIDSNSKSMFVANLRGAFQSPDWNTDVVSRMSDLNLANDINGYIRYYTGNTEVGTINYGSNLGVDYAYTGISFKQGISWSQKGFAGCNIGRSILYGDTNQTKGHGNDIVQIMRPTNPYLLVDSRSLKDGKNLISLEVSDADMPSPISTSTIFTSVKDIYSGKIDFNPNSIGQIKVKGGTTDYYILNNAGIKQGNALEVSVTSESGIVRGKGHIGHMLDFTWTPNHDHDDIETYAFFNDHAAVQVMSDNGKVYFYKCRKTAMTKRACDQYASYPLRERAQPIKRFYGFGDIMSTWTCDSIGCYIIFVQEDGDVTMKKLSNTTKDVYTSPDPDSSLYMRVVVSDGEKVQFYRASVTEPEAMVLYYTLEQVNSGQTWFCPSTVYHCPNSVDVFEVLNDCDGYNQRILKFFIGGTTPVFIEDVNVDSLSTNPFFCPMGSEFIVGSTMTLKGTKAYSFTTHDSLNFFSFPQENLGSQWTYNCLSSSKRFVTYGHQADGTVTATVMLGNRGAQQLKRFPAVIPGINAVQAEAYTVKQGVLHWFNTGNESVFVLTYDAPWLELTSKKVDKDTDVDVDIVFTNPGTESLTIKKTVTVTA